MNLFKGRFSALFQVRPFLVSLAVATIAALYLFCYMGGEIRGNINWHVLPGAMFGVPEEIAAKGFEPLYLYPGETGWDGQFYYYISNDLLAQKDTAEHIDADAYRYQRIGLPLLAKSLSVILGKSWVSPTVYYLASFIIVVTATYVLSVWIQIQGFSPWISLFWGVGIGTQLTLLNGLPDAAADGLLILSIVSYLSQNPILYCIFITLAALSREAYILIAGFILLFTLAHNLYGFNLYGFRELNWKRLIKQTIIFTLPCVIFVAWQIYLKATFAVSPREQATGILGYPFWEPLKFFFAAITLKHQIFGEHLIGAYMEAFSIAAYCLLMGLGFWSLIEAWRNRSGLNEKTIVVLSFFPILFLYLFFGPTVMMHYTGYMKAANILFFLIPFGYILSRRSIPRLVMISLVLTSLFFSCYLMADRVIRVSVPSTVYQYSKYPADMDQNVVETQSCLKEYSSKVEIVGIEDFYANPVFAMIQGKKEYKVFDLKLSNLTSETFKMARGTGGVRLSYQWLNAETKEVALDGIRSFLPTPLLPDEEIAQKAVVEFPQSPGDYILRLSPVQEECAWFYLAGDNGFVDLNYTVR